MYLWLGREKRTQMKMWRKFVVFSFINLIFVIFNTEGSQWVLLQYPILSQEYKPGSLYSPGAGRH